MNRICTASNFERYVELSFTINDPRLPMEIRNVDQLGTLDARIYCIYYIPVAQRTLWVRDTGENKW
jgi:hypothetical protein